MGQVLKSCTKLEALAIMNLRVDPARFTPALREFIQRKDSRLKRLGIRQVGEPVHESNNESQVNENVAQQAMVAAVGAGVKFLSKKGNWHFQFGGFEEPVWRFG